ncbi:MAG: orotidine 5-phosphate decarboxylase, subfamily 2 [Planctomycetota bacterium]|nr:orotidine 5-phosphate decarboxylase, subfamily 2 [Planctomycetota bacterium]
MGFGRTLGESVRRVGNPVVVGIDPRAESLPSRYLEQFEATLGGRAEAYRVFGRGVVDVVGGMVPAVKFQAAFYEALGPRGLVALQDTMEYARGKGLLVILDGKRNDIGSTAEAYAQAYLGEVALGGTNVAPWDADALTINPYLGGDGITPFSQVASARGKGLFVLVKTSNPSSRDLQDLVADGKPIYRHVAESLANWAAPYRDESGYSLVGAVVGATYPEQLAELREALPGVTFLVPGYGTQGGTAKDVAAAFDGEGMGAVVNNSRGLTFAYLRKDLAARFGANWQAAIEAATKEMIDDLAANTPAGKLRTV